MKFRKKFTIICSLTVVATGSIIVLSACSQGVSNTSSSKAKTVVIYTNADTEAEDVMKSTLDKNGFKDEYKFAEFGSADLNTKIKAEGTNLEADIITLSTFYINSAQKSKNMFTSWKTPSNLISNFTQENFSSPILGLEGGLIVNTAVLKAHHLPTPTSIKDLANPEYKGDIAFPSLQGSTTGWLMVQALISKYGESEATTILAGLIKNAGAHVEMSGSAPVQDVTSGQVAVAYGLRQQGVEASEKGQPIKVVDPTEGNYVLTESIAVVNHKNINPLAKKMAEIIATKARPDMMKYYSPALFQGETQASGATRGKYFSEPLTTDLLQQHTNLFLKAKANAAK